METKKYIFIVSVQYSERDLCYTAKDYRERATNNSVLLANVFIS
jgi:hypothetical protein